MGSSVSTLNNYSGIPLFTFGNKELLRLGMASMQGQVNENRAKLTSLTEQLALDIDVARPVDKQYFQERLQQTIDIVNQYAAGDISNPALMGQLTSKLKESIDERVYNGVAASALRNKGELPQWQEAKKKGDGSFNEKNFAYASQAWNKYMNSTDPNETYNGGGGFIKYVDYDQRLIDPKFQKALQELGITAKYVVREDGGGYFDYVSTMEGTTDKNRLMQAVQAQIGEDGFKQMDINAWAKYGDASNPEVVDNMRNSYNSVVDTVNQRTSEELEILQGQINSVPQAQKALYQQRIDELQQTLEDNKGRDFDSEVVDAEGYLDPIKYENLYKGFNRRVEFERLTNLTYQAPRMIETKVEDIKLDVLKYQENVRHALEMEQQGRDGLTIRAEELELKKLKAEADGLIPNPNNGVVSLSEIVLGEDQTITEKEVGTTNQQTLEREAQTTAVAGVNSLVGDVMGEGDTAKLIQDLAGVDIGSLTEITIAGRKIAITDENRADVYSRLDNFKKTMVDGTSTVRYVRGEMSKIIDLTVDDMVQHHAASQYDQKDLVFTKDNFYFAKGTNGTYEYKEGLMPGAKASNYNLLMYKKTRGQKLTDADQMTLNTYITNGIVSDKGLEMTHWERQQMYAANQETIVNTLGAKAVNTMKTYVRLADTDALFMQDSYISGLGRTDGWGNIGETLKKRLNERKHLVNADLTGKSVGVRVTPLNIVKGSATEKAVATKFATEIKGVGQLRPVIANGKPTGDWQLESEVTTGTGEKKKVTREIAKDKDGVPITFSSRELGIDAADYFNTPYNAILGDRAAKIELGGSGYTNYPKGDSRNVTPSTRFVNNMANIENTISQDANATEHFNSVMQGFSNGDITFRVETIDSSETYYNGMHFKDGRQVVISDTGKKILSQKDDVARIYGGAKALKEDLLTTYFLNYYKIQP